MAAPVVLLGPQGAAPDVGAALTELGIAGQVALVNAGHRVDEADDAELVAAIGRPVVNLRLHARANDVFANDPEFAQAYQARQLRLRNLQSFYRIRLDKTDDAGRMIAVRWVEPDLLAQEDDESVSQLRLLDASHLQRCAAVRVAFDARWTPAERASIARNRDELRGALGRCVALVIAGGHVASLLNRLALFDVVALAAGKPIVAWSAGAMVLTDKIVLFHDFPPYGSDIAQVLDAGLGLAPGVVVLPDPHRRLRLDDRHGIARFARRMAPASCVALDHGARVVFDRGGNRIVGGHRLLDTGDVDHPWTGGLA